MDACPKRCVHERLEAETIVRTMHTHGLDMRRERGTHVRRQGDAEPLIQSGGFPHRPMWGFACALGKQARGRVSSYPPTPRGANTRRADEEARAVAALVRRLVSSGPAGSAGGAWLVGPLALPAHARARARACAPAYVARRGAWADASARARATLPPPKPGPSPRTGSLGPSGKDEPAYPGEARASTPAPPTQIAQVRQFEALRRRGSSSSREPRGGGRDLATPMYGYARWGEKTLGSCL